MKASGNYLTRLETGENRVRRKRTTNIDGTVFYLRRGVRGYCGVPCKVLNISESDCRLRLGAAIALPEHFYLVLDHIKAKFPCALISRVGVSVTVRFATEIPSETVDALAEMRFARAAIKAAAAAAEK